MMKAWLKKATMAVSYRLGLAQAGLRLGDSVALRKGHYFFIRRKAEGAFLILMYHRVNDEEDRFMIERTPSPSFDQQMQYLACHFNVLSLETVLDRLQSREPLPKRCVTITFDDGYEDNYCNAFPILKKYDLPATIFLAAGCLDAGESLWFDRVLYAFEQTMRQSLTLQGGGIALSFQTRSEKFTAAIQTLYNLMSLPCSIRSSQSDVIFSQLGVQKPENLPNQMLNWSQVREMAATGISFGSHTLTHPILTSLSLPEAEQELTESKRLIEAHIHRPVRLFAYPNGKRNDYSPEIINLIKKAGYEIALTTMPGINSHREDLYQLKRIKPNWRQDLPSFALSLSHHHLMMDEDRR